MAVKGRVCMFCGREIANGNANLVSLCETEESPAFAAAYACGECAAAARDARWGIDDVFENVWVGKDDQGVFYYGKHGKGKSDGEMRAMWQRG